MVEGGGLILSKREKSKGKRDKWKNWKKKTKFERGGIGRQYFSDVPSNWWIIIR